MAAYPVYAVGTGCRFSGRVEMRHRGLRMLIDPEAAEGAVMADACLDKLVGGIEAPVEPEFVPLERVWQESRGSRRSRRRLCGPFRGLPGPRP